jgi:hypothetical protein
VSKDNSTDWELAIDLPLGVVASQLSRIEAQLRLLNTKAIDFVREREQGRLNGTIATRLEHINLALDSIRSLMSGIQTDVDAARWSSDAVYSKQIGRKPHPERDD